MDMWYVPSVCESLGVTKGPQTRILETWVYTSPLNLFTSPRPGLNLFSAFLPRTELAAESCPAQGLLKSTRAGVLVRNRAGEKERNIHSGSLHFGELLPIIQLLPKDTGLEEVTRALTCPLLPSGSAAER